MSKLSALLTAVTFAESFEGFGYGSSSKSPCGKRLHSSRKRRPQANMQRASRKQNRGVK